MPTLSTSEHDSAVRNAAAPAPPPRPSCANPPFTFPQPPRNTPRGAFIPPGSATPARRYRRNTDVIPTRYRNPGLCKISALTPDSPAAPAVRLGPALHPQLPPRDPRPAVWLVNGQPSYLYRDQLGSVRMVTDAGRSIVERTVYRPFGEERAWHASANLARENRGFIGQYFDGDAGLLYLNARYMDPRLGLFTSPDWLDPPIPGVGTNRCSYSFNDPVNLSDPNGNIAPLIVIGVVAVVAWASSADPANAPGPDSETVESNGTSNMAAAAVATATGLTAARVATGACAASQACTAAVSSAVTAETMTDGIGCAGGDMTACAAAAIPAVPAPALNATATFGGIKGVSQGTVPGYPANIGPGAQGTKTGGMAQAIQDMSAITNGQMVPLQNGGFQGKSSVTGEVVRLNPTSRGLGGTSGNTGPPTIYIDGDKEKVRYLP